MYDDDAPRSVVVEYYVSRGGEKEEKLRVEKPIAPFPSPDEAPPSLFVKYPLSAVGIAFADHLLKRGHGKGN